MMHKDLLEVPLTEYFDQPINTLINSIDFGSGVIPDSTDIFDLDEYLNDAHDVHCHEETPVWTDSRAAQTEQSNDVKIISIDSIPNDDARKDDKSWETVVHIEPIDKPSTQVNHRITTSKCLFENYPYTRDSELFIINKSRTAYLVEKMSDVFMKYRRKEGQDGSKTKDARQQCKDKRVRPPTKQRRWSTNIKMADPEGQSSKYRKIRVQPNRCYHLWDFLRDILSKRIYPNSTCVEWVDSEKNEFRIANTREMASLWGECKRSTTMTYDKLSRAIRYYCSLDILKKIEGKRLHFKFGNGKMWTRV